MLGGPVKLGAGFETLVAWRRIPAMSENRTPIAHRRSSHCTELVSPGLWNLPVFSLFCWGFHYEKEGAWKLSKLDRCMYRVGVRPNRDVLSHTSYCQSRTTLPPPPELQSAVHPAPLLYPEVSHDCIMIQLWHKVTHCFRTRCLFIFPRKHLFFYVHSPPPPPSSVFYREWKTWLPYCLLLLAAASFSVNYFI
jgi:hypothetical protein